LFALDLVGKSNDDIHRRSNRNFSFKCVCAILKIVKLLSLSEANCLRCISSCVLIGFQASF